MLLIAYDVLASEIVAVIDGLLDASHARVLCRSVGDPEGELMQKPPLTANLRISIATNLYPCTAIDFVRRSSAHTLHCLQLKKHCHLRVLSQIR